MARTKEVRCAGRSRRCGALRAGLFVVLFRVCRLSFSIRRPFESHRAGEHKLTKKLKGMSRQLQPKRAAEVSVEGRNVNFTD